MASYFEYKDWDIEDLCDSIRERIHESKQPLPKKVMKHNVSIVFRIGEGSYQYPSRGWFSYDIMPNFITRQDAEKYLDNMGWIKKVKDNFWVEDNETRYYETKNGDSVPYHYEVRESDYENWEDDEYHTEYSEEEKKTLSEALYWIEKARVYMRTYDHCSDQGCFGHGGFSNEVKEELERFEKEYSEELPSDYNFED